MADNVIRLVMQHKSQIIGYGKKLLLYLKNRKAKSQGGGGNNGSGDHGNNGYNAGASTTYGMQNQQGQQYSDNTLEQGNYGGAQYQQGPQQGYGQQQYGQQSQQAYGRQQYQQEIDGNYGRQNEQQMQQGYQSQARY